MIVLGIETTCDETAIAVVQDGCKILSNVVYSQSKLHAEYGGVVPELASRNHINLISSVLQQALIEAKCTLNQIDLIAVAKGPGLLGSILVGLNFAKGLALGLNKPFIGVNHVEAHLFASFIEKETPPLPALGVVISGGHTALLYIPELGRYELIGETQDDAIGETFDKVASFLGLPYPGGPAIEALAKGGNPHRFPLKAGKIKGKPFDFSFSGLKTGTLYLVKGQNALKSAALQIDESDKKDVAASFQYVAFKDILDKTRLALEKFPCKSLLFGGGVSSNMFLRELFALQKLTIPIYFPEKKLALDNASMIAALGYFEYKRYEKGDSYETDAFSRIDWALSSR